MDYLKDIPVLVLGLGESGLAMARWCGRLGAKVRVWDTRGTTDSTDVPNAAALAEHVPEAVWVRGELSDEAFIGVKLVLKSPGLSPRDARIAAPVRRAQDNGVLVQGELDLFARALADLKAQRGYAPQVLAITGTNGKTTTTAMTGMLVARTGKRVAMAGNIGPTMLQTLADALDLEGWSESEDVAFMPTADTASTESEDAPQTGEVATPLANSTAAAALLDNDTAPLVVLPPPQPATAVFEHLPEVWVLELSSFQLDDVKAFEPSAAAILNITQDHLDWHGSMHEYALAKSRVFGKNAILVVNRDDGAVESLVPAPQVQKAAKGRKPVTSERSVVRFGLGAPRMPGDFGITEENGMAWLVRARELDETFKRSRGGKGSVLQGSAMQGSATQGSVMQGRAQREAEELIIQRLMPADALRVRGRHNAANALAALALATAIDCPLAPMLHGLREYSGEPHRVQYIATLNGVDAIDDSKGTNVGATVAALNGLGADKAPGKLVVILGGDGKGQDFSPLAEPVRRHVRAVATIGRDAAVIEEALARGLAGALAEEAIDVQRFDTLQAATRWCFERARSADAVLLSPACASLDMFRNYAHRAEVFVSEVHSIVADHGGVVA